MPFLSFHSGEDKRGTEQLTAAMNLSREVLNMAWVFCHYSSKSRIQMPRAFHPG
jgi:hypothetical protein